MSDTTVTKKPRGFAALSKERVQEIARLGGLEAHRRGTGHQFSPELAREAGRKGGQAHGRNIKARAAAKQPSLPGTEA